MRFKVDIHFNFNNLKVNRIIKYLVLSDLLLWAGWGLVNPIVALFIVGRIAGATVFTVGVATALYWIVKAAIQIPVAIYLDRHEGEKDDFNALIIGLTVAGFAFLVFPLVQSVFALMVVEVILAIAFGLYTPSWSAIFSRHLDTNHYAFDWSLDSTTIGISTGISAFIGGAVASLFGFNAVFIVAGILALASAMVLFSAPHLVLPKVTPGPVIPEHTPGTPKV